MTEEQKGIMGVLIDRFIAVWSPGGSLAASPVLCFTCCSHAIIQFPVPSVSFLPHCSSSGNPSALPSFSLLHSKQWRGQKFNFWVDKYEFRRTILVPYLKGKS